MYDKFSVCSEEMPMRALEMIAENIGLSWEYGGFAAAVENFGNASTVPGREKFTVQELYDLDIPGVKKLIKLYINEFTSLYRQNDKYRIYASVPCPTVIAAAFNKTDKVRICTAELCTMVVLRGILGLDVNFGHSGNNRCAMMENRAIYLEESRLPIPDGLWSFGLLCDECCKTDELICANTKIRSWQSFCQRPGQEGRYRMYEEGLREDIASVCAAAGCDISDISKAKNISLRASLLISQISCANSRCPVLKAGTLSLINTAQLCAFGDYEALCKALEMIRKSMRTLPEKKGRKIYNYYIPPCVPELGMIFEEQGMTMVGDAAFLTLPVTENFSADLAGATAANWAATVLSHDGKTNAEHTAKAIKKYGCTGYMTGLFSFDRWLGAGHMLTNGMIESLSDKPVFQLDMDFWGRNMNINKLRDRAETIGCMLKKI